MIWMLSDLIDWYKEKRAERLYTWAIKHIEELPIEPVVINAGEWVKVEENQKVPQTGIYLFLCRGDNHLLYEVHELYKGMEILASFQGDRVHTDGWFSVKPICYYYIPNPK